MARRVSHPAALAFNLDVILDVPLGPEQTEARLTDAMEVLRLSEAAGDTQINEQCLQQASVVST